MQKSARSVTCKSEKTRKNYDSVISLYNKVGPQAAVCRFTSGFTFQPQMRYPVLVQITTSVPGPSRWDGDEDPGKIHFIVPKFWEKNRMRSATQPCCNHWTQWLQYSWIRLCLTAHAIFSPKFWNDKTNFTRVFVTVSPRRPWDRGCTDQWCSELAPGVRINFKLIYKYACIAELHCRLVEPLSGTNLPPYLLLFFDQRQICHVHTNLQTANVIGKLTTNLGLNANRKVFWNRQYWQYSTGQVVMSLHVILKMREWKAASDRGTVSIDFVDWVRIFILCIITECNHSVQVNIFFWTYITDFLPKYARKI